jgi:hypothetical protein
MSNVLEIYGHTEMVHHINDNFEKLSKQLVRDDVDEIIYYQFDEAYIHEDVVDFFSKNPHIKITNYTNADFPDFYFYMVFNYHYSNDIKSKKIVPSENLVPYSFLPGTTFGRFLKCEIAEELAKRNLLEKGVYSWTDTRCALYDPPTKFQFEHFKNEYKFLDHTNPIDDGRFNNGLPFPKKALENCIFSIVVEEAKNYTVLSEKTATALFHQKSILLISATTGTCDKLKELGFDLCEDIVDLKYDTVLDKKLKAKLLVDQVEKICDLDPLILYEKTKNSREHNFKTFLNIIAKKPKYHEIFRQWCFKRHMPLRLSWS